MAPRRSTRSSLPTPASSHKDRSTTSTPSVAASVADRRKTFAGLVTPSSLTDGEEQEGNVKAFLGGDDSDDHGEGEVVVEIVTKGKGRKRKGESPGGPE